jgi:hypothetical protein
MEMKDSDSTEASAMMHRQGFLAGKFCSSINSGRTISNM